MYHREGTESKKVRCYIELLVTSKQSKIINISKVKCLNDMKPEHRYLQS